MMMKKKLAALLLAAASAMVFTGCGSAHLLSLVSASQLRAHHIHHDLLLRGDGDHALS